MAYVEVYDKGEKTFDRYIVFIGDVAYAMSENVESPQGMNQFFGEREKFIMPASMRVSLEELPQEVHDAIGKIAGWKR